MKAKFYQWAIVCCLNLMPYLSRAAEYTSLLSFEAAGGTERSVYFNDLPDGALVDSQYATLGLTFPDLNDHVLNDSAFYTDDYGLNGNGTITLHFSTEMTSLGVDFPGSLRISLFNNGTLVGVGSRLGGNGEDFFGGLISDRPFNLAVLSDWSDGRAFIDNLYFSPLASNPVPVPESGGQALVLLSIVAIRVSFGILCRSRTSFCRRGWSQQ